MANTTAQYACLQNGEPITSSFIFEPEIDHHQMLKPSQATGERLPYDLCVGMALVIISKTLGNQ